MNKKETLLLKQRVYLFLKTNENKRLKNAYVKYRLYDFYKINGISSYLVYHNILSINLSRHMVNKSGRIGFSRRYEKGFLYNNRIAMLCLKFNQSLFLFKKKQ